MARRVQHSAQVTTSPLVSTIIEARRRRVQSTPIRRLLPTRTVPTVGPFVFLDHMGPVALAPGEGVDIVPHPHIHLATVTYLFEGELVHRDSLGSSRRIRPGDINWMHAGSGIVHSERTPPEKRVTATQLEGIQLWTALPSRLEETPPEFDHYPKDILPEWSEAGVTARVLAGSAFDRRSPVRTVSNTLYVDVSLDPGARLQVPEAQERAVYVARGSVSVDEDTYPDSRMMVLRDGKIVIQAHDAARILILGGDRLDGPRYIWWNFVSSSPERIEQAKQDWLRNRFPGVPGDRSEHAEMPRH